MNIRGRASLIAAGCLLASSLGATPAVATQSHHGDFLEVRRGTAAYHSVNKAMKDGYMAPIRPDGTLECVPGMGYHFVNYERFESTDPAAPGALLYAPKKNGKLRLIGAEWFKVDADQNLATDEDRPSMFGKEFDGPMPGHAPGMPIHYDLHAYVWTDNPDGVLATWNPEITCPAH